MDNLLLGPEAQLNHAVAVARSLETVQTVDLSEQANLVPGIRLSIDPEARLEGNITLGGGRFLAADYRVIKTPRWLALHLELGAADLRESTVFGVVCKSYAPEALTMRLCLRSGTSIGFSDSMLPKHVVAFGKTSTHVDLIRIEDIGDVPRKSDWRELIIFFPNKTCRFELIDLRVFIV